MLNGNSLILTESFSIIPGKAKPEIDVSGFVGVCTETEGPRILSTLAAPEILHKPEAAMSERFIKFIPSEEAQYLQRYYPNAFLLLCLIAQRARRCSGHPDGLEIGEAHIGDFKEAGIASEKMYRTAKSILSERGHIKIIETCRNRKKGATKRTTVGTKVKILRSDIWDINSFEEGDPKGDRGATEGRPKGDEQERKRKKKNVKNKNTHLRSYSLSATELCAFFYQSLQKHSPELNVSADPSQAEHFEKLLEKYSKETITDVLTFALTDEFWKTQVTCPRNLVRGTVANPDRFEKLLQKLKSTKAYETAKKPAAKPDAPRRVGEIVV